MNSRYSRFSNDENNAQDSAGREEFRPTRTRYYADRATQGRSSEAAGGSRAAGRSSRTGTGRTTRATGAGRTAPRTTGRTTRSPYEPHPVSRPARGGRNVYVGNRPSAWQQLMDALPQNVWASRAIVAAVLLLALFILFNMVTCVGGVVFGSPDKTQPEAAEQVQGDEQGDGAGTAAANAGDGQQGAQADQAAQASQSGGVESPWIEGGVFSTGDSALDSYVKQLCDEHTQQGATFDQGAYDTYIYVSRTDYVERENNQSPWGETWDVEYAKQYFEEGQKGNCYNFAAVTEYVLKYFGYSDAEAEPCIVKLESGAWGDHGLVFVTNKVDGKRCIIDDALSADGWMLDIDAYDYDVRNINQNATVQGNVDAIDDEPMPIPAGELTE